MLPLLAVALRLLRKKYLVIVVDFQQSVFEGDAPLFFAFGVVEDKGLSAKVQFLKAAGQCRITALQSGFKHLSRV